MYQIDSPGSTTVMPTIGAAGTPGFWTDGNPGAGQPATVADQDWFNTVQQELINICVAGAVTPVKGQLNNVLTAINELISTAVATALTGAGLPSGSLLFSLTTTPLAGTLEVNGASLSRTTYATLFGLIGTAFGAVDGAHFNLPDLRAYILRAWDDGRGLDVGRTLWSFQQDMFQGHYHSITDVPMIGSGFGYTGPTGVTGTHITQTGAAITDGANGTPRVGIETVPKNFAPLILVKY